MKNLQRIPSIDELLQSDIIGAYIEQYNREFVLNQLRQAVAEVRNYLQTQEQEQEKDQIQALILEVLARNLSVSTAVKLQQVINATGVVLHTNLGRAPLSQRALELVHKVGADYNNLEYNLVEGRRGARYDHVEAMLTEITKAEAAMAVNNNAAAVLLSLNALADKKEVLISRGQLIEIGGAFRMPEVMKMSGAVLREVGTTNKTYIEDFQEAINENTALLFTAHTSNYKIVGFTENVAIQDLVRLGKSAGIPVLQDLGSGALLDMSCWGLGEEPTVQSSIKAGVDIVTFSGDKLLGGPQAGIIAGKKNLVAMMRKQHLTRAIRVDKLTLAALEGTLQEYLFGNPLENIPVIKMLTMENQVLKNKAQNLLRQIKKGSNLHSDTIKLELTAVEDMVGGGAYPDHKLPGWGIALTFPSGMVEQAFWHLRRNKPVILGRIQDDRLLISVRTILAGQERQLAAGLVNVLEELVLIQHQSNSRNKEQP